MEMAAGFAACGVGRNAPIHAGLRRGMVRRELVTMMANRRKGVVNSVNPYVVLGVPREVSFSPAPPFARGRASHQFASPCGLLTNWRTGWEQATQADIKKVYRKLSQTYHPDVNQEPGAQERFIEISQAYSILGDDEERYAVCEHAHITDAQYMRRERERQRERETERERERDVYTRERERKREREGSCWHSAACTHAPANVISSLPHSPTDQPSGRRKFDFSFKEGLADDFAERVNGFREAAGPQYNR